MANLIPCLQNAKLRENPYIIIRHRPKIYSNPNILAYSKSPWTEANMHTWLYGWNMPQETFSAFRTSHSGRPSFLLFSRISVFVFLSTFKLTALLLKRFHPRLHCYTLPPRLVSPPTTPILKPLIFLLLIILLCPYMCDSHILLSFSVFFATFWSTRLPPRYSLPYT